MRRAVFLDAPGPPRNSFRWAERAPEIPGHGEILIRHTAIGVNYKDVLERSGRISLKSYPAVLGTEAAGIVESVGVGVESLQAGDRVAYFAPSGAYSESRLLDENLAVSIPVDVSDEVAAAALLKGLTAHYLLLQLRQLHAGSWVLFHAAAGGVGLLFCQLARRMGVRIIGTASTATKRDLAVANGCEVAVGYDEREIADAVTRCTEGRGVAVAYDSVGRDTFASSLDSLAERGLFVSFGSASGSIAPVAIPPLFSRALSITVPNVTAYNRGDALARHAAELFDWIRLGQVNVRVGGIWQLKDASAAHEALESRSTTGSLILKP